MFDAVLKKDNDPISDAEIVEFPIPEDRYKKTIRALNKIQIGSANAQNGSPAASDSSWTI